MSKGFTLMEVLLVLVLLAGSSVAVLMTFPDKQANVLADSANQFYQRLRLLSEEAMLNGMDYGVRISDHEYHFLTFKEREWQEVGDAGLFKSIKEEDTVRLVLSLGSEAWEDKDRLFKPGSLFEPSRFDDDDKKKVEPPQVWVMSSGEITPFTLRVEPNPLQDKPVWRIVVTENSDVKLLSPMDGEQP